ncbi:uncharacterized protein [Ptychodera flava]|uniref:uncharacterized protein n=1 Tax=Ptychodera flava TaxID=63121 RepID=UPI00396A1F6E
MVVKITVAFSKDTELTEDEVITAFTEAATRRNQDASMKFRVYTDSVRAIMVNRNQSENNSTIGQIFHKSTMTTVPPSPSNTGNIVLVVSLVVLVLIAAFAGILISNFYRKRQLQEKVNCAKHSTMDPREVNQNQRCLWFTFSSALEYTD